MGITPRPAAQGFSILRRRTHRTHHHNYYYDFYHDDYDYCSVAADDCFYHDYDYCSVAADDCFYHDYFYDFGGGFAGVRCGGGGVRWFSREVCGCPAVACCA